MKADRNPNPATTAIPELYGALRIKCLLETGGIARYSFWGNGADIEAFVEKLEGRILEIQILSWEFMKPGNEEDEEAM